MLSVAVIALLSVEAGASARGCGRVSARLSCCAEVVQAGSAIPAEYSADEGPGTHAGENKPDSALVMLRRFYTEYIAGWDRDDKEEVLRRYLTPRFFDRLQRMYTELELDYDPFLEAQDCDESVLKNLRIERDSVRPDVYRILLWDNFNRKYRKAELLLIHGADGYRIDGIPSLPEYYTRDPD